MGISLFDLYSIGIGPSSSHTVGPMRAALRFNAELQEEGLFEQTGRVKVELFGSLGLTGKAHGSEKAVLLGLEGEIPETIDPDQIPSRLDNIRNNKKLNLAGKKEIPFFEKNDLVFHRRKVLKAHANGMKFSVFNGKELIAEKIYYSIGGGFIVGEDFSGQEFLGEHPKDLKHPFETGEDLLKIGNATGLTIAQIMLANESAWHPDDITRTKLLAIWDAMEACVERGLRSEGVLPGGLHVERRAPAILKKLQKEERKEEDPLHVMDWVNLYALSVNEENAAGGKVVTAPTNGAAGIIPAVLHYYKQIHPEFSDDKVIEFLATAGAIGLLYKKNASISGAEVGCQGEVGVACSMAAAGLTAVQGGSNEQIENAAEIGMEHNLGLTCDPVGGLVQIPCIERNAMGAVKAINASRIALRGDGSHKISLDKVIKTMFQTGKDMQSKYKETSRGGLAAVSIGVVEC